MGDRISAGERDLVVLARALIAAQPLELGALLAGRRTLPPAISPGCEALLGDALAQVWPALWRRGGVAAGASVDGGGVRRGRPWERHAPTGLAFSVATLRLLRWLLAMPLPAGARAAVLEAEPLTIGDQVIAYLALDATAGTPAQASIAAQPLVRAAPLARLGFAELLAAEAVPEAVTDAVPGFATLCRGAGAIVVEALQSELAQRWRAVELSKPAITAPGALIALGAAQDVVLQGFLAACDHHRRRDLASFVLDAAAPLVARAAWPLPGALHPATTLASRAAARVAAGALLRGVATWAAWDQAHRGVRFIDDDYTAAQLLLARFEAIGASGASRVAAWLSELAALAPTPPGAAATVEPL